jgi:selenoprotein W-related protein
MQITCQGEIIWARERDGDFPEAKILKRRVRDQLDPERSLGHSDREPSLGKRSMIRLSM